MKKTILSIAFVAVVFGSYAQVGVGTAAPKSTLEVRASGDAAAAASTTGGALVASDGVTVPRTNSDMTATSGLASGVLVGQLVFSTHASSTGFYYWSGTAWTALVAASGGGSSSAAPNYGAVTNVAIVSNAINISASTSNHFTVTGGGLFAPYLITLPPHATNTGRKIVINNAANATSTATFNNPIGGNGVIAGGRIVELVSTGTGWALITNN